MTKAIDLLEIAMTGGIVFEDEVPFISEQQARVDLYRTELSFLFQRIVTEVEYEVGDLNVQEEAVVEDDYAYE